MRIPHTIPKTILRAFTRKLDEEALKKSYEGRVLVSEDPNWDESVAPTLAQQCLGYVTDEFIFFDKLLEYFNELKIQDYEKRKAKWEADLADYVQKRAVYETKLAEYENKLLHGDDPNLNFDDDSDDDDDHDQGDGDLVKSKKGKPIEPEKVDDEFPDYVPVPSVLDQLKDDDRIQMIEEIELDLVPFPLAIKIIPDNHYWERQARDRWQILDVTEHGKSWRRLYMEKHAWDAIERFHPADHKMDQLVEDMTLVGGEVIRLNLQNLIPICFGTPAEAENSESFEGDNHLATNPEFDKGFRSDKRQKSVSKDNTSSISGKKSLGSGGNRTVPPSENMEEETLELDRRDSSHLNLSVILPIFSNLKEMTIVYEMVETGMAWEDRLFRFTDTDCINLARGIALTPTLEKFELLRSRVSGEQCKTLVREGLIKLPHLKILNLNYNCIGNDGARAVARLLVDDSSRALHTIHTVRIARNRIRNRGGKALAFALTKNRHLAILDARLNSFGDPAGRDFGYALVKNTGLMALFLGANRLTEESAFVLGKMLYHNKSLKELDVSSNSLGKKGGEFLALGMRNNKTILRLDLRLSNVGLDFEYDVGLHLRKNRNRLGANQSIVDSEDYYPPETESGFFVAIEEEEEESDQDEEEEEEYYEEDQEDEGDDDAPADNDEEADGPGGIVGGIAAAAFAAAGISGASNAELALKDPNIVALLAKAVGAGAGGIRMDTLLKSTKKAMQQSGKQKNQQHAVTHKEHKDREHEVKVVKEPTTMKSSNHALL